MNYSLAIARCRMTAFALATDTYRKKCDSYKIIIDYCRGSPIIWDELDDLIELDDFMENQ